MKTGLIIGIVIGVIVIIGVLAFVFMGGNSMQGTTQTPNPTPTPTPTPNPTQTSKTENIAITNFAFSPATITINKGDTIVWTNMGSVSHTVTSDSGNELASSSLPNGQTYSHTFNIIGTFSYHCSIHTMMKGTVTVQ